MKTYIYQLKPNIFLIEKRLKKVKYLKDKVKTDSTLKLVYKLHGNLILLQKKIFKWSVVDETGPWHLL